MLRIFVLIYVCLISVVSINAKEISFFVTSNLEGRFYLDSERKDDPVLSTIQSYYKEKSKINSLQFIDMGNAFFPGTLSRYSKGSIMYDCLLLNGCAASLVASEDLMLRVDVLKQLENERERILLSSNILKNNEDVFLPYVIVKPDGVRIALIGLSNDSATIDAADKRVSSIVYKDYLQAVNDTISRIKETQAVDYIIVMSGLAMEKNMNILRSSDEVSFIISGGDSRGEIEGGIASRVILPDGRTVLMTDARKGYYMLHCEADAKLTVSDFVYHEPLQYEVKDPEYIRFMQRLNLWKSSFVEQQSAQKIEINENGSAFGSDYVAELMRYRYKTEIGIAAKNTVLWDESLQPQTYPDIYDAIKDDHIIYTYRVKGSILKIINSDSTMIVAGLTDGMVKRYPVDDSRDYTVASTQRVFERVMKYDDSLNYRNRWDTVSDIVANDYKTKDLCGMNGYAFMGNRISMYVKVVLSHKINNEEVTKGDNVSVPAGMASITFKQWGYEDKADIVFYNQYHSLTLSPYINFVQQKKEEKDKEYLKNTLRGTGLYQLNVNQNIQPYLKTQYETIVKKEEDGLRPVLRRNTAGCIFMNQYFRVSLGAGMEKMIHDEKEPAVYGYELGAMALYTFFGMVAYSFEFNSFISRSVKEGSDYSRYDYTHGLSLKLNPYLALTTKYKKYRYKDNELHESYTDKVMSLSLDVNVNWKM